MYRFTLTVVQIMDLYEVTARLREDSGIDGAWEVIATRSDSVHEPKPDSHDPLLSVLEVVRLWSERAIEGQSL